MLKLADKVKITKASHGSIYMGAGKDYLIIGEPEKAVRYLAIAEELLSESLGEIHETTSVGITLHAQAIFESGNREKGLSKLQSWIRRLNEEKEGRNLAEMKIISYRNLALLQLKSTNMKDARSATHEAKRLIKKFRGKEHISLLPILTMEAISYNGDGFTSRENRLKQEALYTEAVNISKKDGNTSEQARAYLKLGSIQKDLSKFEQAESSLLRALSLQQKATGKASKEAVFAYGLRTPMPNSKNLSKNLTTALERKKLTSEVYGEKS